MTERITDRAAELRKAFDDAFSRPIRPHAEVGDPFVGLRIGEVRLAVPLAEALGLARLPTVVHVPGAIPALMGLVGVRGELLPVYDAAGLIGLQTDGPPVWMLTCGQPERFGLVFEAVEGLLTIADADRLGEEAVDSLGLRHVSGAVVVAGRTAWVLDLASLAEGIATLTTHTGPSGADVDE